MTDQFPEDRDLPEGRHAERRAHLLAAMEQAPARRAFRPRLVLFAGVAGTAVAASAAAFALAPSGGSATPETPTMAPVSAVTVLTRAADAAAAAPDLKPRPDQFVYVESKSRQSTDGNPSVVGKAAKPLVQHRRVWLSTNGRRGGLLANAEGGRTTRTWLCDQPQTVKKSAPPKVDLSKPPRPCTTRPGLRGNLPTDPKAMRGWLYRNSQGGNPPDVQAFITVGDTIREAYVPPASLAAMFRAARTIPGVTVRQNVVDLAGRRGVTVGQTWNGTRQELIFDARTYRFLGERSTVDRKSSFRPKGGNASKPKDPKDGVAPSPGGSASQDLFPGIEEGFVLYESVNLTIAVTDRQGQSPG